MGIFPNFPGENIKYLKPPPSADVMNIFFEEPFDSLIWT